MCERVPEFSVYKCQHRAPPTCYHVRCERAKRFFGQDTCDDVWKKPGADASPPRKRPEPCPACWATDDWIEYIDVAGKFQYRRKEDREFTTQVSAK